MAMFEPLMVCEGELVDENKDRIRFTQEFNDLWIPRREIRNIRILGMTQEGNRHCSITITESYANQPWVALRGEME